jgi:tetratricopeptide (TPR) repeat protein
MKSAVPALAVFALAALVYANTLGNGFVYDDFREIVNNPSIRSLAWKSVRSCFFPGPWGQPPPGRSLPLFTFALDYAAHGLRPLGYHLVNILLQAVVSLLIFSVTLSLFPSRRLLSFLTAAFFAVHPVHADVAASVVGRSELISSLCFLLSIRIYLAAAPSLKSGWSWGYWSTLPLLLIGALSKATAWTLPFVAFACDLVRFRCSVALPSGCSVAPPGATAMDYSSLPTYVWIRFRKFYLPWFLLLLALFALYARMLPSTEDIAANYLVFLPRGERILAVFGVLARYLALLAWPARLSCDYSYAQLSQPPDWIRHLWSAGGIAAVIGAAGLAAASLRRKGEWFLAVVIFAVNYAGVSNLFFVIDVDMAERLIYMAAWGFFLGWGLIVERAWARARGGVFRAAVVALVFLVLAACSARTWTRNRDWKDNFTLFAAAYRVCPRACRVNYNLGLEYYQRGDLDRAIFHYREAARILPWNALYRFNLGEAYVRKGETGKAIPEFLEAVRLDPDRAAGFINLANAWLAEGFPAKSIEMLFIARELDPADWRVHFNLGDAFLAKGDLDRSAQEYENAALINPGHWPTWNRLGTVNLKRKDYRRAAENFRRSISLNPSGREAHNNLGLAYAALGEKEKAAAAYRKALQIDPGFGLARNNLQRLLAE